MANKRVLVTSSGVYAVKDGITQHLVHGEESSIDAAQADKLAERGRVELIINKKPKAKAKPQTD